MIVAALVIGAVAGLPVQGDPLGDLAAALATPAGVRMRAESDKGTFGRASQLEGWADARGVFELRYFDEGTPRPGKAWSAQPWYFVAFDGKRLHVADPPAASMYQRHDVPQLADTGPGPVQWLFMPWPVLPRMVDWLRAAPDLVVEQRDKGWRATSPSVGLAVEWTNGRVDRLVRGDEASGAFQAVSYGGYGRPGFPGWAPSKLHEVIRTGKVRDGREVGNDVVYRITLVEETARTPPFDAGAVESNLHDAASGDVFGADGSLLFNLKAAERELTGESTLVTARWVASAVGAAAIGVLVWRRWRGLTGAAR